MNRRKYHFQNKTSPFPDTPPTGYYFLKFFKKKGARLPARRPGAMGPQQVKNEIERIGVGYVVEILRVGFDGEIDDIPIIIEILNIRREGFTGKIVNVERQIIEESSKKMVYAKYGGGMLDFNYNDGDIKEIIRSRDIEELSEARDVLALIDILSALEINDTILVAYYDKKHRGTVNVEGILQNKSPDNKNFTLKIEKINNVELETKKEMTFNVESDLLIDIALV